MSNGRWGQSHVVFNHDLAKHGWKCISTSLSPCPSGSLSGPYTCTDRCYRDCLHHRLETIVSERIHGRACQCLCLTMELRHLPTACSFCRGSSRSVGLDHCGEHQEFLREQRNCSINASSQSNAFLSRENCTNRS